MTLRARGQVREKIGEDSERETNNSFGSQSHGTCQSWEFITTCLPPRPREKKTREKKTERITLIVGLRFGDYWIEFE